MDEKSWLEAVQEKNQETALMETNSYTEPYGLRLTQKDARLLAAERMRTLKEKRRVEFGGGILPKLIYAFCDSAYIGQEDYVEILARLQEIFYMFKNEMQDEITDDELITFMREQFDGICFGDLDYLEGTCLDNFAQAVRSGYRGFHESGGRGEYGQFDEVTRWDRELYLEVLKDLCWK